MTTQTPTTTKETTMTTNASDTLYDSETSAVVTAEDLGIDDAEYERLCDESCSSDQPEGHVRTSTGRRVYAST